jgi:Holliday junction resolvase
MPNKSKQKGNTYETELVNQLKADGLEAKRAWGSNGASIGETETTDVVYYLNGQKYTAQAKRRAKIPEYLKPPQGVSTVMTRGDREDTLVILRYEDYIQLLKNQTSTNHP